MSSDDEVLDRLVEEAVRDGAISKVERDHLVSTCREMGFDTYRVEMKIQGALRDASLSEVDSKNSPSLFKLFFLMVLFLGLAAGVAYGVHTQTGILDSILGKSKSSRDSKDADDEDEDEELEGEEGDSLTREDEESDIGAEAEDSVEPMEQADGDRESAESESSPMGMGTTAPSGPEDETKDRDEQNREPLPSLTVDAPDGPSSDAQRVMRRKVEFEVTSREASGLQGAARTKAQVLAEKQRYDSAIQVQLIKGTESCSDVKCTSRASAVLIRK